MTPDLIYVFCLSGIRPEFSESADSISLKSLVFDEFHVVMKYVSADEFSEENFKSNLSDMDWLERNAREHVRVNNMLMAQASVIPFKFGTIFHSENSLQKFIHDYSDSLAENLSHINGMEEWSVKIYCDRKSLKEKIDELSEEAADLEKQIMASSPGKAFLLKRKKSDLIENEMDRICKKYGQEYFNEIENLSKATNLNNLLPKEFTGREDNMILNASFLIHQADVNRLKTVVDEMSDKFTQSGFFIETSGPWAPFSFIHIKENLR